MIYITKDDEIHLLGLSPRLYNCLRRTGIDTVGDLLSHPHNSWKNVRSLGQKSLGEIESVIRELRSGAGRFTLVEVMPKKNETPIPYPDEKENIPDISVEELGLSARALHCLKSAGIDSVSSLSSMTESELMCIKNMGEKTAREITERLSALRSSPPGGQEEAPQEENENAANIKKLAEKFSTLVDLSVGDFIREIADCRKEWPCASENDFIIKLCARPPVREAAKRSTLKLVENTENGLCLESLISSLPAGAPRSVCLELFDELEKSELVFYSEGLVYRRYPSAEEFARQLPDRRNSEMLLERLRGCTLDEIGKKWNLTRERVRQVTQKALRRHPRLREDRYLYMYENYDISQEDLETAFGEPEETYNYLEMNRVRSRSRKPLKELLTDENIPVSLRRKAEKAVYRQYVTIDGVRVEKKRQELVRYVIRTKCRRLTTMEEFISIYENLLNALGLEDEKSLVIDTHTYENTLNSSDRVLWNLRRSFRYYPIWDKDYGPLIEGVNLGRYNNCELSSMKLFIENPELMKDYDIRDEYELHNLLKKVWPENSGLNVRFKKMPTIEVGCPDRDTQVKNLLLQYAPVSGAALAEKYEELYGVKQATASANYFGCIDQYFQGGFYRVDMPPLPEDRKIRLSELLTEDFYRINDIKRIYIGEFPGDDPSNINDYTLKQLNFRVYVDYVIKNTYSGASEYFRSLLTKGDIADMTEYVKKFSGIVAYSSELYDLKASRKIIEFDQNRYINSEKLLKEGYTEEDFQDYCLKVSEHVRENEYFTVCSLNRGGFCHPLYKSGFGERFFSSLLVEDRDRFSYRRIGGNRVFMKGKTEVQLSDFLRCVVSSLGSVPLARLQSELMSSYGVSLAADKLANAVKSSNLYYDAVMKTVYINYGAYISAIHKQ